MKIDDEKKNQMSLIGGTRHMKQQTVKRYIQSCRQLEMHIELVAIGQLFGLLLVSKDTFLPSASCGLPWTDAYATKPEIAAD